MKQAAKKLNTARAGAGRVPILLTVLLVLLLAASMVASAGAIVAFAEGAGTSFDAAHTDGANVDGFADLCDGYGTQMAVGGAEYNALKAAVGAENCKNYAYVSTFDTTFGKILRFQQFAGGKVVDGAQLTVTVDKAGKVLSTSGRYVAVPRFSAPVISRDKAIETVRADADNSVVLCEDIYFYDGDDVFDVYKLTTKDMSEYYISKQTGDIVYASHAQGVVKANEDAFGNTTSIDVAYEDGKYILKDDERKIYIADARGNAYEGFSYIPKSRFTSGLYTSDTGENFAPMAVTVFEGMQRTYDFYTDADNIGVSRFGITNKNNNGDPSDDYPVFVFLNYSSNAPYSAMNNNAYFTDANSYGYICIGNGVRQFESLYQQGRALDVIAHEYQHGVTNDVAGLLYEGESGALDEAFSDIFGALIEGNDPTDLNSAFWTLGENAVYNPFGASDISLRSLKGGSRGQIYNAKNKFVCNRHKNGYHNDECDNNGVHTNSTIISTVQYQLSLLKPQFFTRERIGTLWFTTLLKLTRTADFMDFTNAFINSAIELGYSEELRNDVMLALSNVGLKSDEFKTVTFMNAEDRSVLYYHVLDRGVNTFDYASVRADIESDIVTDECTLIFNRLQNRDGTPFDTSVFDDMTDDVVVFVSYYTYCTATFLDADGNVLSATQYPKNSAISPPTDFVPDKDKFEFHGWRTQDMAEDETLDLSAFAITQNITLVPAVTIKSYTVKFYSDGKLLFERSLNYGDPISFADIPAAGGGRDGLYVEGWYLDPQLQTRADNITVTQNIALYAKWQQEEPDAVVALTCAALVAALAICCPLIIRFTAKRHIKRRRKA